MPTALASGNSAVCLLLLFDIAAIAAITASTAAPSLPAARELKGPRNCQNSSFLK
jgi:hypothetical protein